jgi:EamA domain-containing membrane protein RarD
MESAHSARKRKRLTLCLAVVGFVIAAAFAAYFETQPRLESPMVVGTSVASLLLCPGSFLFVTFIDAEPHTGGFLLMWTIVGLLNFGVYGAIGAVIGRWLWKSE